MLNSSVAFFSAPELIKHVETVTDIHTKSTPFRYFQIPLKTDDETNNGRLVKFRFISVSVCPRNSTTFVNEKLDQLTTALKFHSPYGIILQSKEKTITYPVVQFCDVGRKNDSDSIHLVDGYSSRSCLYKEVRQIEPEVENGYSFRRNYIILGFKTVMTQALLDSWKDWTGARYIYINFPQQLGLGSITLYHNETADDVNLFSYIVVVNCDGVDTKEKQTLLYDFVQRLRVERTSNFISLYEEIIA